jgi:hypothetical protein
MKSEPTITRISVILGIFPVLSFLVSHTTVMVGAAVPYVLVGGWALGAFLSYVLSLFVLNQICPWRKLAITAEFNGILPKGVREKAREAKDQFDNLYLIVDQQHRWKSALLPDPRPRILDPLLIGELKQGRGRKYYLIHLSPKQSSTSLTNLLLSPMELSPGWQRKTSNATGPGFLLFIGYRVERTSCLLTTDTQSLPELSGTAPQIVTDWFARRKTPTLEQGTAILEFLKKQKRTSKPRGPLWAACSVCHCPATLAASSAISMFCLYTPAQILARKSLVIFASASAILIRRSFIRLISASFSHIAVES